MYANRSVYYLCEMAKANFYIEQSKANSSDPEVLIYLYFRFKGKTLKMSTGVKVKPEHWDSAKQRVKKGAGVLWADTNSFLSHIENSATGIYKEMVVACTYPTVETIKAQLLFRIGRSSVEQGLEKVPAFLEFIETFIATAAKANMSSCTLKKYRTTVNHLKGYQSHSKLPIDFKDITLKFYSNFMHYLTNVLRLQPNTVGCYIKTLKIFLNAASERLPDGTVNKDFKSRYFKSPRSEAENIYLTEVELNRLYELDLKAHPRLERVRDLFLIGCYTGLRFSDLVVISKTNIHDNLLVVNTQKTQEKVYIPIHYRVTEILSRYNYQLPKFASNQKMNVYLKEVGQLAGIDDAVERIEERAGKRTKKIVLKHTMICTHTARRSFATNAYLAGVPMLAIMRITGHTKESTLLKYIKVTKQQHAQLAAEHPFFKK